MFILNTAIDSCPDIADPVDGQIEFITDQLAPFDLGTLASYICAPGFGIDGGNTTRVCEGDGNNLFGIWNGTAPSCVGQLVFNLLNLNVRT